MLRLMSDAYMDYGLAQSHEDFGVEGGTVWALRASAIDKLRQARELVRM